MVRNQEEHKVPYFVGEFHVGGSEAESRKAVAYMLEQFDAHGVGWAKWSWKGVDNGDWCESFDGAAGSRVCTLCAWHELYMYLVAHVRSRMCWALCSTRQHFCPQDLARSVSRQDSNWSGTHGVEIGAQDVREPAKVGPDRRDA